MQSGSHVALNAHLLSGEASYRSAGIHGYLYQTITRLAEVEPSITYTVLLGRGQIEHQDRLCTMHSRWPTQSPLVRIMWEQVAAPFILGQLKPDLLHGMGFSLPLRWHGASVVTVYDLSFFRYPERLSASRRLYLKTITRQSAHRASRVLAISESGKAEIETLLGVPAGQIDVARPGVGPDFQPLSSDTIEAFRVGEGLPDRFILHVGTLEPRKNLPVLLEAFARLPLRGSMKLVLAGGRGWQYEPILALIETLDLKEDVILPGYIANDALPLWYNAAEILAFPSIYEGFGLPILEAMACGTPVIATNGSSLPEAVGPDGILLAPDDVGAWVDALSGLLQDVHSQTQQRMRGLNWAKRFTWEQTARHHAMIYQKILA